MGTSLDSFNHSFTLGRKLDVSPGDITEMDVIGYDAATVPEPSTFVLLGSGLAIALATLPIKKLSIRR